MLSRNTSKAFQNKYSFWKVIEQYSTPEEIKKIILSYGVPPESVMRWVALSGDSPRFAHMIGENLQTNPTDVLSAPETFYERIIAGYEDPKDEAIKDRKRVLLYISLLRQNEFVDE